MFHFVCSRPGARRPLHSFPTRRSSDLVVTRGSHVRHLGDDRESMQERPRRLPREELGAARAQTEEVPSDGEHVGGVEVPDRKSTRLNSSHVEISYAVFCLKKKNDYGST